jgi:hypothetical protein
MGNPMENSGETGDGQPPQQSQHANDPAIRRLEAEVEKDAEQIARDAEKFERDEQELERLRHVEIMFFVDGEEYKTRQSEWTPNAIICDFGEQDPATHYLVEITREGKKSFQGKGDEPIHIHEGERFQIISTGPTPVSDKVVKTGAALFIEGLAALGYKPELLPDTTDHVRFDYVIGSGTHAGRTVRLGFIVPQDFPLTAPGGPHVSPHIHSISPKGSHPAGGVHKSPRFEAADGRPWQYWSRPFTDWGKSKKTVAIYMSHIWRLWDSQ